MSSASRDGLIATEDLSLADVPAADADVELLEQFCITIDGYEDGRRSADDLLREAARIEERGLEAATLAQLRTAAFIHQRHYRWSTYGDAEVDAPLIRKIRNLVAEIRNRLDR